jgi:hypothetical protein
LDNNSYFSRQRQLAFIEEEFKYGWGMMREEEREDEDGK